MQFFGKSDKGLKRLDNQDSFITEQVYDNVLLCVVCDGMGGANGGSVASSMACASFLEYVKKNTAETTDSGQFRFEVGHNDIPAILGAAVENTNTAIFKKAIKSKRLSGMGTTLVAALFIDNMLYIVNVGDSRLYLVFKDKITQATHDHSFVQTLVDLGQITPEEAHNNPNKNIITKAIGIVDTEEPDIFSEDLSVLGAEYVLLCSDGLSNFVEDEKIHKIIIEGDTPENICSALIDEANSNGGGDNITTVLVRVKKEERQNTE